jgi:hypothetical protein
MIPSSTSRHGTLCKYISSYEYDWIFHEPTNDTTVTLDRVCG